MLQIELAIYGTVDVTVTFCIGEQQAEIQKGLYIMKPRCLALHGTIEDQSIIAYQTRETTNFVFQCTASSSSHQQERDGIPQPRTNDGCFICWLPKPVDDTH